MVMEDVAVKKPRVIAADNPYTASVLVRVRPGLLQDLDAWLADVNERVVGPRWSRTDLVRAVLERSVQSRPDLMVPLQASPAAASPPAPVSAAPVPAPATHTATGLPIGPVPAVNQPDADDGQYVDITPMTPKREESIRSRVNALCKRHGANVIDTALSRHLTKHRQVGCSVATVKAWRTPGDQKRKPWIESSGRLQLVLSFLEELESK